jgi:hypothetical protein
VKAKKNIRVLRALAIAGSMSALVVPTAVAMQPTDIPYSAENAPAMHQPYVLPAGFHTEAQSVAPQQRSFSLPSNFKPEVGTTSSPTVASAPGSIVHEIRTVTDNGSQTLPIVLAAIALAIALGGVAYGGVRLTRMQRDLSSRAVVS